MSDPWDLVDAALNRPAEDGRIVELWLRDDDAVAATAALTRLTNLCASVQLPVLLAVIPDLAEQSLAAFAAQHDVLRPTQHGFRHCNHAATGERARELGGTRPLESTLDDLALGGRKLDDLFGELKTAILVPPWNRIDPGVLPHLPGLGFKALSAFGAGQSDQSRFAQVNANIDIIDWRNGRRCRPMGNLCGKLVALIESGEPIGLLTHHLVHDEEAWMFLDLALGRLASHHAVRFVDADTLCARMAGSPSFAKSD